MLKTNCKTIKLNKGCIYLYTFPTMQVHVYRTNDFIDDEAILLVKNNKMVVIESPCFYENIVELEAYIKALQVEVEGVVLAYHMAGGSFLPRVKKFATAKANHFGTVGGGKALVDNFTNIFGKPFDSAIHGITHLIPNELVKIGDIELKIVETNDAFDIIIPEIQVIYTHMLGHDCHSILGGTIHAQALIEELEGYIKQNYELILTAHYDPEDLNDVRSKIDYIKQIIKLAEIAKDKDDFKRLVIQKYPNYTGLNYLDITANSFFS